MLLKFALLLSTFFAFAQSTLISVKPSVSESKPASTIIVTPRLQQTPTQTHMQTPTNTYISSTNTPASTPLQTSTPAPDDGPTITPPHVQQTNQAPIQDAPITNNTESLIFDAINAYRASQGLVHVSKDSYTCSFAQTRAEEISTNFNHEGFNNRQNSNTLPYPTYTHIVENISMNSDYAQVVPNWIASPGHAQNMMSDTPHGCLKQFGNYYVYEGWKP